MKVTTLIEDSKRDSKLINEFGLSLFIEAEGRKILLDTGTTGDFIKNCTKLGANLQEVDEVILSHAHADHGGGLLAFLKINQTAPIYMHEDAGGDYFANICCTLPLAINHIAYPLIGTSKIFSKYIGLERTIFDQHENRIRYISKTTKIAKNIFLLTNLVKKHSLPEGNKYLLRQNESSLEPDDFSHEIVLAIKEDDGITIFSGCCHSGLLNILESVKLQFDAFPVKAIIGGFHLRLQPLKEYLAGTKQDVKAIAEEIKKHQVGKVYTGHCTGKEAYSIFKDVLKERIEPLYTGKTIEL